MTATTIGSGFHKPHLGQPDLHVEPLDSAVMTLLDDLELLDDSLGAVSSDDDMDGCSDRSGSEESTQSFNPFVSPSFFAFIHLLN